MMALLIMELMMYVPIKIRIMMMKTKHVYLVGQKVENENFFSIH